MADPARRRQRFAAITMVRDDRVHLGRWIAHYGAAFGRRNLFVVSHGDTDMVREVAADCTILPVPALGPRSFDAKRWRFLNGLAGTLLTYHHAVVVGDVDELLVPDPASGKDLSAWITESADAPVTTPLGLEVVHLDTVETDAINGAVLGPRRHVQIAQRHSKPCLLRRPVRLSRGGHYAACERLEMPDDLYLFHMRYADRALYAETMDRRNGLAGRTKAARPADAMIGRHWFASDRNDDAVFAGFAQRSIVPMEDFTAIREGCRTSWRQRDKSAFWNFDPPQDPRLFRLPDRFMGVV